MRYYRILGLDQMDLSLRQIQEAYKQQQDLIADIQDSKEKTKRYKELNEAYAVLSDRRKKLSYDFSIKKINAVMV